MMKNKILILLLLISSNIFADCSVAKTTIGVNISEKTLSTAYNEGIAQLENDDHAFSILNGDKTIYNIGFIEDDNAGNFSLYLISEQKATYIEIIHDHETWHQGLDGYFTTDDNKIVELNIFKDCDYDSLFN